MSEVGNRDDYVDKCYLAFITLLMHLGLFSQQNVLRFYSLIQDHSWSLLQQP